MIRRALIVVFWLLTGAWLVRYEAFPGRFEAVSSGYAHVLSRDILVMDEWMRILFQDAPIGYSHTRLDLNEESTLEHYVVENRVHLKMRMLGLQQDVHVETEVYLDTVQRLQRFAFGLTSRDYHLRLTGRRESGSRFGVEIVTAGTTTRTTVEIPDDVVIYSPMTELAMRNLRPGENMVLRVLDPASLTAGTVTVHAERAEPITVGGRTVDATRLTVDYLGIRVQSWLDAEGRTLRQTTPFGWSFERCTPTEALAAVKDAGFGPDLLARLAVPCRGNIMDPRHAHALTLRLRGVEFGPQELRTARQTPTPRGTKELDLVVRRAFLAEGTNVLDAAAREEFLRATPFVQSDHPDIRRQAARIVDDRTNALERAVALHNWVHRELRKQMVASLPSALDVLHSKTGDCNEHTYLFVALARAAGIPAKIIVGLAYHEGSFYYHAWPAVYLGGWVEMDPTWGQQAVDATHLALVEGELANQMSLARILGSLSIEVLAGKEPHD